MIFKGCLYWILFFPLITTALEESDLSILYDLLEKEEFYTVGSFQGANQTLLSYGKFGKGKGKNGSLIFVNGKGENLFQYMELFYDFYLQGWSPIYTYDHRNQGFSIPIFSPLFLSSLKKVKVSNGSQPNSKMAYTENYVLYREDLEAFIRIVLNDTEVDQSNLFVIAHSKGGAIVLDYLQTHSEKPPFKSVALSSPMISVKSQLFPVLEKGVLSVLNSWCSLLPCSWKIPSLRNRLTYKKVTDSANRYAFSEFLVKKKFPKLASRGTSFYWILGSFKITDRLMDKNRIQRIKIPLMILQAEKDYFVSNKYHNFFCERIPDCCYIEKIPGKHEIFMETDELRNKAVKQTMRFFLNNEKYQKKCQS